MTQATTIAITEPGVYDNIPDEAYHADPVPGGSLSVSGARMLLPPNCPAKYRHWAAGGRPPKKEFDTGKAAHALALGTGPEVVVIDAEDYRTKAARAKRDDAHANGAVPVLASVHDTVTAMAEALRAHPLAGALLGGTGRAEASLFWVDETGVWLRARPDWLPTARLGDRAIIVDYKTCQCADRDAICRAMHSYGYNQQADWYGGGVSALGLSAGPPVFFLVFQEKEPPYLVAVGEPNAEALEWGQRLNRKAIDIYRQCKRTGQWPGYADDTVLPLELPTWVVRGYETAAELGAYDIEETR